jgi:hypothetical protein
MIGAGERFMGRSFESVEKRLRLPAVLKAARVISFLADRVSEKMAVTEPSVPTKGRVRIWRCSWPFWTRLRRT